MESEKSNFVSISIEVEVLKIYAIKTIKKLY